MALFSLRHVLLVVATSSLVLAIAEASIVRQIEELKQSNAIPGMTQITLAGAIDHGQKELEAWLATVAPGIAPPIHRHQCEEVFIVLKGSGTVFIAPESERSFPREPKGIPFSANSTFSIPSHAVHRVGNVHFRTLLSKQCEWSKISPTSPLKTLTEAKMPVRKVVNTNDEDLQVYAIFSNPPMKAYVYKDWNTPHDEAVLLAPKVWDKKEATAPTKDELDRYHK